MLFVCLYCTPVVSSLADYANHENPRELVIPCPDIARKLLTGLLDPTHFLDFRLHAAHRRVSASDTSSVLGRDGYRHETRRHDPLRRRDASLPNRVHVRDQELIWKRSQRCYCRIVISSAIAGNWTIPWQAHQHQKIENCRRCDTGDLLEF